MRWLESFKSKKKKRFYHECSEDTNLKHQPWKPYFITEKGKNQHKYADLESLD